MYNILNVTINWSFGLADRFHCTLVNTVQGNSKSCHLDAIPTKLLKQVLDALLPVLTKIANSSLQFNLCYSYYWLAVILFRTLYSQESLYQVQFFTLNFIVIYLYTHFSYSYFTHTFSTL